jgi:hypothetical protein
VIEGNKGDGFEGDSEGDVSGGRGLKQPGIERGLTMAKSGARKPRER